MKPLPFKMRQETEMEKYRAETFWTKEPETLAWIESFKSVGRRPYEFIENAEYRRRPIFFDIGSNIGLYSMYCARCHAQMHTFSFEPMPSNFLSMVENIRLNDLMSKITPMQYAVGKKDGVFYLDIPNYDSGASGAQLSGMVDVRFKLKKYVVVQIKVDDMGPWAPDYVKIDIDGQELAVIHGMKKTLPHVKSILVEVSKASKQPIMDILTAAGFTTDNRFNTMTPHSRERREREGIDAENIVFTR